MHGLLKKRPSRGKGVAEEFLSRKQWRSCCGMCHKSQAQLLGFSSGATILGDRDSVCGSVPTPPVGLGAWVAHPVLEVLEITFPRSRRAGRDQSLCCAWHHPAASLSWPSVSSSTSRLTLQGCCSCGCFSLDCQPCAFDGGMEGGESQSRGQPIFRLTISHSLEGWVPIRWRGGWRSPVCAAEREQRFQTSFCTKGPV